MLKFDTKQINNLIAGNTLALEIPSSSEERRAFVVVSAVEGGGKLNTSDTSKMKYWLRKYEVSNEYLENDWDVSDDELINSIHIIDILGLENLEKELSKYLSDISKMDVEWKCDNPI
ncbi:hypothetical protein FRY98_18805 [Paenibacillus faecis]|uniref:Uncharacterized protein n=1 Tax=Paenibacillus faecis TaxID=862114 RepID=A0A5D0CMX7_9BACL|nr:hypothetical protein [Paenibacillus faecis]TYA11221.1 hypothetical protein FRY98_18805 [Paenibacillus faecis]